MDYLNRFYSHECMPMRIDKYDEGLMNCHECDKKDCRFYYDYHERTFEINPDIKPFIDKLNEQEKRCKSL